MCSKLWSGARQAGPSEVRDGPDHRIYSSLITRNSSLVTFHFTLFTLFLVFFVSLTPRLKGTAKAGLVLY
ncbi:MAG TPA: hypothetical protein PLP86_04030, partial [Armatimonadota bacterium]|nr:hypothetical protein [Armatimonadota bacterium]